MKCFPFGLFLLLLQTSLFAESITHKLSYKNHLGEIRDSVLFHCGLPTHPTPGEPQMPYEKVSFLLPPDILESSISVSIANKKRTNFQKDISLKCAAPYYLDGEALPLETSYRSSDLFPPNNIFTYRILKKRQSIILEVTLSPYQYSQELQSLTLLEEGMLTISYERMESVDQLFSIPPSTIRYLKERCINFNEMKSEYLYTTQTLRNSNYHIITTKAIESSLRNLDNFIANKKNRGFTVTVVTEEQWGGGSGDQSAENLRNWLEENYLSENIEYVLLIGDPSPATGNMAMKVAYAYYSGKKAPTDYYFAELTGNWDADGDGKYGELDDLNTKKSGGIDAVAEISVGRIPYYSGDATKVDAILQKIMDYENSNLGATSWRNNMLLAMDGYYGSEGPEVGEKIYQDISSISSVQWDAYRIYCSSKGSPDKSSTSITNVTNAWAPGKFGVVSWLTHGKEDAALHIMDVTHVKQLSNDYPSIVMMGSCLNGKPEVPYNLAFSVLQRGGIAVVAGSETTIYKQPMGNFVGSSYNHGFIHSFTTKIACDREWVIHALDRTREESDMGCWKNYCAFNLYGDPTIGLDVSGVVVSNLEETSLLPNNRLTINKNMVILPPYKNSATVEILNIKGQRVGYKTLQGERTVNLKSFGISTGVYICKFQSGKSIVQKRITL